MGLGALVGGPGSAHDGAMIDLREWEEDLERLQVTRAPLRLGGRVIWIAGHQAEQGEGQAATAA